MFKNIISPMNLNLWPQIVIKRVTSLRLKKKKKSFLFQINSKE